MGVAHSLCPMYFHTVWRKAGKRHGKGFDFVNDGKAVFFKDTVRSSLHTKTKFFPIFLMREKDLRLVSLSSFFLQAAMNFRTLRCFFQRISSGSAFQISAAQKEFYKPSHRKPDFLHRPHLPHFLPV